MARAHRPTRIAVVALVMLLTVPTLAAPAVEQLPRPLSGFSPAFLPLPHAAVAAEIQSAPGFVAGAVMPNGQVGLIYENASAEIRFKRYFTEHGMDPSQQLSTAAPWYPQLATFQGKLVAEYVDTRGTNSGKLILRTSTDNGATWTAEVNPFGTETFDQYHRAPQLVTSRDGQRLYLFTAPATNALPQYRYTMDANLQTWTAAADAGDTTMHVVQDSDCTTGNALAAHECERSHDFWFAETFSGAWVYVARTDIGTTNGSRGTQVGTLGGSWSTQVYHGGGGGLNSGAEGDAIAFVDRDGNVYFIRDGNYGHYMFLEKSTDGGYTWAPRIYAYSTNLYYDTFGAPFALYVPGYSRGEYIWYAGFGGQGYGNEQNTVRVLPLWTSTLPYEDSGTRRLFGNLGGDDDFGTAYPYTFGARDIPTGIGAYKTQAEDLSIPGRLLNISASRSYTSADAEGGPLGPGWSFNYDWRLTENGNVVDLRRGDGRRDEYLRNPDGTYAAPPNVYDVLVKNVDNTFTLTLKNQTQYEFSNSGQLTRIHEPAGNQITLNYTGPDLTSITDTVGRHVTFTYDGGTNLARGMTYTESVAPSASYPDTNGLELTDGIIGKASNGTGDLSWQGHQNLAAPLDVTVDLGTEQALGVVRSHYYHDPGQSIYKPASVEVFTSSDNLTYTSRGIVNAAAAQNDSFNRWQYDLDLAGLSARWVRLHITSGGTWLFSTEIQVFKPGLPPITAQPGTNLAFQHPYDPLSPAPNVNPDTNGTELTDGNLGSTSSLGDAGWVGYSGLGSNPVDVTVDLGSIQPVRLARSYFGDGLAVSIFGNTLYSKPSKVEVFTSNDKLTFASHGTMDSLGALNDAGIRWRYDVDLGGTDARYVRFRITPSIITSARLLIGEVQAFPQGAVPVELPVAYGSDRLTSVVDPIGRKVTYGYDQLGRLTEVVDKIGNSSGQDPLRHAWHYTYAASTAHITSVIDPDGRTRVSNTYNSDGRLVSQRDGMNNETTFGYASGQTTVTDPRQHTTTQLFDTRWRLTEQDDVVGQSTLTLHYLYEDAYSNLTATIDRNGNRTDYTYDDRGNVLTKLDPQIDQNTPRYLTQYLYDARNNLTQITDARSFVTTNTYDPTTNVKSSTTQQISLSPASYATTKWEYTDAMNPGLPTKIISPRGNTGPSPDYAFSQSLSYDSQGNLAQRIDADGNKTTFGYDGVSRQTAMVDADGYSPIIDPTHHTWTTAYDENDRVTEATDPLIHSTFTGYDGAGNRTSVTDRDGNVTTYAYDAAARLATVQQKPDPVNDPTKVYTTTVTRDVNGNASRVAQDSQGAAGSVTVITDYGYDAINRLTSVTTHPTAGVNLVTSYVLDGNGNATQRTTGDNVTTTYGYDALSRLSSVSATGLSTISYGYDELSHRTSMSDATGSSSYQYDGLGRLTQAIQPNGTLGYEYDLDSNRAILTYPTVGDVAYVYSNAGRLTTVMDWANNTSSYTYYASGLAHTVTVPGGMTTTYEYDSAQRLWHLVNATASGTITSDTYTLDNEGNRIGIDEQMPTIALASAKVNSDTGTAVQDHPAIAFGAQLPSPSTYLIWDDQRDGSTNSNIYFALRDGTTGTWSANVKVNDDTTTRNQANPAIAVDASNNAYAVWDDLRLGSNNKQDQNIYYAKRSASTGSWSSNLKVNDDSTSNPAQRNPRIAGTAAGAETAVWVDYRSNELNIYSSTLVAGGNSWSANKRVTDNTSSSVAKDLPDVAVGSDGTSYAVWQDSRSGNADIYFSSLTSGGGTWAANSKISDDPGSAAQTNARIGVDGSGNLIAAWIDARTTPSHVRVARRPSGGSWSASTDITSSPANVQGGLSLSVRADGFAWATWADTRSGNADIYGSRFDPNTNTWSAPVRLDDDGGTAAQTSSAVAIGATEVQLAWRDNRLSANGDVQARKISTLSSLTDHLALSYDGLNRLTKLSAPVSESFTLDGPSNITSRTGPGQTDSYDQSNRITSDGTLSYTWSDADRLTNRGTDTFAYDPLDRMTSSTVSGASRTYAYNGDGLLQSRSGSGAATFLWDPNTSPSRLLEQGSDNIVYGLGPLYAVKGDGSTVTFARDGSKNVRAELDGSGAVTAAFRYLAYGQLAQSTASAPSYFGLASQLVDPSGLYYMRARWYDPLTARFMTRDPNRGDAERPSSLNAYDYALASPLMLSDPTGLCPFCVTMGIGAIVGGVAGLVVYQIGCSANASCTVAGAAGAAASGAITGALIGLAGPAAASLIAATPATGAISAAATAGLAITLRAGVGAASYYAGGAVTDLVDIAEHKALEFSPDLEDAAGSALGAALGSTALDAAFPLRGVNRLSQYMFAPRTWLSTGANMERLVAGVAAAATADVIGAEAETMRPQQHTDYDFTGLYFTQ